MLKYRTVYGRYINIDGTPKVGYLEFKPTAELISTDDGILLNNEIRMDLDENGDFRGTLACTDSSNVFPTGWLWQVEEKVTAGKVWWMDLPLGDGSDYNVIASRNPSVAPPSYQVAGTPGLPAVVTIHSTVTGEPGTQASVQDMDTGSDRIANLRFTIPAGATGATGATGAKGDPGATGSQGPAGVGVPVGGSAGQALIKNSSTNYDTSWGTVSGGGGLDQATADARYVNLDGDSMTGNLTVQAGTVTDVKIASGSSMMRLRSRDSDQTLYVAGRSIDDLSDKRLVLTGSTVEVGANPTSALGIVPKQYADTKWTMWSGTQAAYDAIGTKDPNTLYVVV